MDPRSPVFPIEIFDQIIKYAGAPSERVPLSKKQMTTLGACALTSKSFLILSRRQIFHRVDVRLHCPSSIVQLVDILRQDPSICVHIIELRVSLTRAARAKPLVPEAQSAVEYLANLPAVKSLFMFTERPRVGMGCRLPHIELCSSMEDLLKLILESYLSKPTLQYLNVQDSIRMQDFPYNSIFTCPTLQRLQLINIWDKPSNDISFETPIGPQLRQLTTCVGQTPWLISRCPALTDLTLLGGPRHMESYSPPLCKLTQLCTHGHIDFASNTLWQQNQLGFKPISTLEHLSIHISPRDYSTVTNMLEDLPHLKSLDIDVQPSREINPQTTTFADLHLDHHLCSSFPMLTSISFTLSDVKCVSLPEALTSFVTMISSISPARALKRAQLKISTFVERSGYPFVETLHEFVLNVPALLSSFAKINSLEEVALMLEFKFIFCDNAISMPPIMVDDIFLPLARREIHRAEQTSGLRLHPHFSS